MKRPELQHRFYYYVRDDKRWQLHPSKDSYSTLTLYFSIGFGAIVPSFIVRSAILKTPIFKELYGDKQ